MRYHSTRSRVHELNAREAVLAGIAPDGGLYVSDALGEKKLDIASLMNKDYRGIAFDVLSVLLDDFTEAELQSAIDKAYWDNFLHPAITPVTRIGNEWLLELYHGPTAAFKDVALQILPQLMASALKGKDTSVQIVTATSGDTGKAALEGFKDVPGIAIAVFYPHGLVSDIQYRQMATQAGKNVRVAAVRGNFDDVQSAVKALFATQSQKFTKSGVLLSSANSINIGRLAPQVVYYFDAYRQLVQKGALKLGDALDFVVPTGNFGDILAGFYAKRMGLPVGRLVVASNANNVLTDFLQSGVYDKNRDFIQTITPSMDILISSNLERMLYYVSEGDTDWVSALMQALRDKGIFRITGERLARLKETFDCGCADDDEALHQIRAAWKDDSRLIDPHTAVALSVARRQVHANPVVVLSTASPFKFSADVYRAITQKTISGGLEAMDALSNYTAVYAPKVLAQLKDEPLRHQAIINIDEIAAFVREGR